MKRGFLKANSIPPAQVEAKPLKPVLIPVSPQVSPNVPQYVNSDIRASLQYVPMMNLLNIPTFFLLYAGTKEAMLKELEPVKVEPSPPLPFAIEEAPGQGLGAFSRNAYNTGDLIWDECPLLVIPHVFNPRSEFPWDHYVTSAVKRFPPGASEMLYRLHNCKSSDPKDIFGIIETNGLDIGRLPGPYEYEHVAVFFVISRINHSCAPSAEFSWDLKTFKGRLTALRPIAVGEQISIAYSPIFHSRNERQRVLRKKYAFTCDCASCSLSKELSARSDVKRKILSSALSKLHKQQKEHERALREWTKDLSLPDNHMLKPAQFLMQLMQEEQAFDSSLWLTQAEIACKALCALSDRAGVVELAEKASVYAKTVLLGDHAGWTKVAAAPEKTEWWGLRKKTTN